MFLKLLESAEDFKEVYVEARKELSRQQSIWVSSLLTTEGWG